MKPARLVLANGKEFSGMVNREGTVFGEVVFNTGMVGYVEAMTDPSYTGQLLVFTYPLLGNYGVPDVQHWESSRVQVAGIIVSEVAALYSHRDGLESLQALCDRFDIPLLSAVDTRTLTKVLSHEGVVAGCITTEVENPTRFPDINTQHLVKAVSITTPIEYGEGKKTVIVVDCGIKHAILRHLQTYPVRVKQVPFDYDYTHEEFDAVLLSNGPGDPAVCVETIAILKRALTQKKPIFGICLGAQLLAHAIGAKTYKLPFGHRAQNHPCMELATQRCYLTSQNHGYSIDEKTLPNDWQVSFRHLNDGTVQGIAHESDPFFAVQFHPEAAPGPTETRILFDRFYAFIEGSLI